MAFWIRILQTMSHIQMTVIQTTIIITVTTHLTPIRTVLIPVLIQVLILMIIGPLVLIHIIIGYTILIHLITGLHRLIRGMIATVVMTLPGMQTKASLSTKDIYFLMALSHPIPMMMNSLIPYTKTT